MGPGLPRILFKETVYDSPARPGADTIPATKKIESISLDGGIFMDADPGNNTWKEKAF
jgi:hypothetical protein